MNNIKFYKKLVAIIQICAVLFDYTVLGVECNNFSYQSDALAVESRLSLDGFRLQYSIELISRTLTSSNSIEEIIKMFRNYFGKDKVVCPMFNKDADDFIIKIKGIDLYLRCLKKERGEIFGMDEKIEEIPIKNCGKYKIVVCRKKSKSIKEQSHRPNKQELSKLQTTISSHRTLEETLKYIYDENQKKDAKGEPIRPCGIHLEELAEQHGIVSGSVLIKMLIDNKDELGLGIKAHKGKISINQRKIYEIVKDAIGKAIIPKSGFNAAYDNVLTIRDSLLKYYREDRLRGGVEIYFYLMKEEGLLEMNLGQIHTVIGTGRKVKELLKSSGIIDSNNVDEKNWNVPQISATVEQVKCIAEYLKRIYERIV
ncbi:hypothetical protein OMAG_002514 [Candidatus Omnitrophus magneticus]|uniref:Uncharacterized protein n=1 Tax=Candidatus Omnitrophus magneticus TaxID=1609969 RepID=A0A0F0CNN0_9BACT|nr:hypothetical protein OMAG_002514 [Candidatus Omnitrophus magneticus]